MTTNIEKYKYRQYIFGVVRKDGNVDLVTIKYLKKLPKNARKVTKDPPIWSTPIIDGTWSKITLANSNIAFGTGKK